MHFTEFAQGKVDPVEAGKQGGQTGGSGGSSSGGSAKGGKQTVYLEMLAPRY